MLLFAVACQDPPGSERERHAALLARLDAGELDLSCSELTDPGLRADCVWAVVAAGGDSSRCEVLSGAAGDECWFLAAETSGEVDLCARAGRFGRDCRMHALSRELGELPEGWAPAEEQAAARIEAVGLGEEAWGAVYRALLGRRRPLDLGPCSEARSPEACVAAGTGLFHDRLNRARDLGASLCAGELPDELAFEDHPALAVALAARRADDLCAGRRHAPPPDAP